MDLHINITIVIYVMTVQMSVLFKESVSSIIRFPTYDKSAADDFEKVKSKIWKTFINERTLLNKVENIVAE